MTLPGDLRLVLHYVGSLQSWLSVFCSRVSAVERIGSIAYS
jgi:hypothetical protein